MKILLCLSILVTLMFSACQPNQDTFEARRRAAKQLLTKDCDLITDASTEFVKQHQFFKDIAKALVSTSCDCIVDSLSVQFANRYNLTTIQNMQYEPIETTQKAIADVLSKNNTVKSCFVAN